LLKLDDKGSLPALGFGTYAPKEVRIMTLMTQYYINV
jgi:hypothetical protein